MDLLSRKAYVYDTASKDLINYKEVPVPASMKDEVEHWRGRLIEAAAESDDALLEKFFEDPASINEEEIVTAVRKATLELKIVPITCGSSLKIRVFNFAGCHLPLSAFPVGYRSRYRHQPLYKKEENAWLIQKNRSVVWYSKLPPILLWAG